MESARLPILSPARTSVALIVALFAVAAIGWAITDERMRGMDGGPGTDPGTLGFYVSAWMVMMAAMMFPSIWPMVAVFARIQQGKRDRGDPVPRGATLAFVGGYLLTWALAGLVAYAILDLGRSLRIDALAWDRAGPYVAGGVILAAALYELSSLKNSCLVRCRNPLTFLMTSLRSGRLGGLRMGVEHGGWCVGCCWGLMAALFALGVMSLGWMALIAALIATEKLLPWKAVATRAIALLLIVLGSAVAFAPEHVPGLTLPDTAEASSAMDAMETEGGEP